ncbi:MAG TPA: hypothetical protein VJ307_10975 [Candidatus Deferrimicrobiaceae bacterium]|nr:hypothetical protein [Candidatus Deferrimicrobiaceae bacterium]
MDVKDLAKAYRLGKPGVAKCRKCGDFFTHGEGLVITGSGPHCRPCAGIVTGNVSEYTFDEEEPEEEPE